MPATSRINEHNFKVNTIQEAQRICLGVSDVCKGSYYNLEKWCLSFSKVLRDMEYFNQAYGEYKIKTLALT